MPQFIFQIRPLSLEEGFELICDGILSKPEHHDRLYDAVIQAFHVGRDIDAEIRILDCEGNVADTIKLTPNLATV